MLESLGSILIGLVLLVLAGVCLLGYVLWRSRRRMDDAAAEMAEAADQQKAGGGGGPKPVK